MRVAAIHARDLAEQLSRVDDLNRYAGWQSNYLNEQLPKALGVLVDALAVCGVAPAKTYADGIREAIAMLTDWADEADGNSKHENNIGTFRADLFREARNAHREAAEELAKRIAPAAAARPDAVPVRVFAGVTDIYCHEAN
jgi:hypothetical protein